jgi:hypothetical protein
MGTAEAEDTDTAAATPAPEFWNAEPLKYSVQWCAHVWTQICVRKHILQHTETAQAL